jgi:hypothetical protein
MPNPKIPKEGVIAHKRDIKWQQKNDKEKTLK